MKRKILLLVFLGVPFLFFAQTVRTVNITAGNLWSSIPKNEKAGITGLTITGTMDARDFVQLRDSFPALNTLDLSNVSVAAYGTFAANTIPDNAFLNRALFTTFALPKNIIAVGVSAFNGCTAVTAINFPASLIKIDVTSFRNFGGKFTVDAANPAFSAYNGVLYNKSQTDLIQAPVSLTGSYTLAPTTTAVKTYAFYACNKATDIVSNNTAPLLIEDYGFYGCGGLITFSTLSAETTTLQLSFQYCTKLKTFNANNLKIGYGVFADCNELSTVSASIIQLGDYSFTRCPNLKVLTLTSSINKIPTGCFQSCPSLTSFNFISSITELGSSAFAGCTGLTTVTAASPVVLNSGAFSDCSALTTVNGTIMAIGNNVFTNCSNLKTITVSPTITSIGSSAFENCISLPSFQVSAPVSSIGAYAFRNCSAQIQVDAANANYSSKNGVLFDKNGINLIQSPISNIDNYNVPDGVTTLKAYSFYRNKNINNLNISKTVCTIEPNALLECPVKLVIPSDNPCLYTSDGLVIFNKDSTVLIYCSTRKTGAYTLPNSVIEIKDYAFSNCNQLTSVTMNNGLQKIGINAFANSGINSINIPATVTYMGEGAFMNCGNALSIIVPTYLTTIPKNAFNGCGNVTSVSLPNTLTSIKESAFQNCAKWMGVLIIPPSVTQIERNAFNGCASLTDITIPNTITELNYGVFAHCIKLKNVVIPPSVLSLGEYAFYNCQGLAKFAVPQTVKTLNNYALHSCTGLRSLYADAPTPIDLSAYRDVFGNIDKMKCTLFVPAGSKKLYQKAVQWKDFYHIIEGEGFWIGKDTVYLKDIASKDSVTIGSNTTWKTRVLAPADFWLTSSPQTGSLDGKIYVSATENISEKRIGYVVIESKDSKDTLVVVQATTSQIPNYSIVIKALRQCGHQAYSFEASPKGGMFTFTWDFGDGKTLSTTQNPATHDYDELKSATYNVILKVNLGQYNRTFTTKFTTEKLPDLELDNKPFMCQGDTMIVHVKGADKYLWNNGSTADYIKITRAGIYTVQGNKGDTLCTAAKFEVKYFPTYDYVIGMEKKAVPSFIPLIHIWATDIPGSTYYWEFNDGGKAEGREVYYLYGNTSEKFNFIKLNVVTPDGCHQSSVELFEIEKANAPNTFTPNGDGLNDVFLKGYSIKVLDRFGQLLYEGEDGWDGTYKGKLMAQDTYFYVISFKTQSGIKQVSNYVMLIR